MLPPPSKRVVFREHRPACAVTAAARAVLLCCVFAAGACCSAADWRMVKGNHFIVFHTEDDEFARRVCVQAEVHYEQIARDLDYTKRSDFWLWDNRIRIRIFATRDEFARAVGAPDWAAGRSSPRQKEISTFKADPGFLESVLVHELAHMILRDFFGADREVPLWLNEGVAQWEERVARGESAEAARLLLERGEAMPLAQLVQVDMAELRGMRHPEIFYLQSASLVGHLIRGYGPGRFRKLCAQIRDGKDLESALRFTYQDLARSIEELERAWRESLLVGAVRAERISH